MDIAIQCTSEEDGHCNLRLTDDVILWEAAEENCNSSPEYWSKEQPDTQ